VLNHAETAGLLGALPRSARVVVVADTCYAAGPAEVLVGVAAMTVLLAACADNQATLNYPVSEFVATLERLTFPGGVANPDCAGYEWLRRELRADTPDAERPDVWANRPEAMGLAPFR
jgi:hypothetical protein